MKKLVVLLMATVIATGAMAQIDPDDNMIGVYFDMDATQVEFVGSSGNFSGYVCATHPTYEAIYAWEAAIFVDNQGLAGFVNHVGVPEGVDGLQIGTAPNIIMAFAEPIPAAPVTVIGQFDFGYYGSGGACISLGANDANPSIPGQLAVQVGPTADDIVPFGDSANGGVCAIIGTADCVVVPTQDVSFGSVKALYR